MSDQQKVIPSMSGRIGEAVGDVLQPFAQQPEAMRISPSPAQGMVRINGVDRPIDSLSPMMQAKVQSVIPQQQQPQGQVAPAPTTAGPSLPMPPKQGGTQPGAKLTPQTYGFKDRPARTMRVAGPSSTVTERGAPEAIGATVSRAGPGGTMEQYHQALLEQAELKAIQADAMVTERERLAEVSEEHALRLEDLKQRRAAKFKEFQIKQDRLIEEVGSLEVKDFWAKKDTGSKILGGIGVALSAFGSTLTGGQNVALQIINKAMDQDLEVQKTRINSGRARLQDMQGAYTHIFRGFDDEQQAEHAYYVAAHDKAISKLENLEANAQADAMVQGIQTLKAQLSDQRAAHLEQAFSTHRQRVSETEKTVHIPGKTAGQQMAEALGREEYDRNLFSAEAGGNAIDKADLKRINQAYESIDKVKYLIGRMDELHEKSGGAAWNQKSPDFNRMASLVEQIATALSVQNNLGAISKDDRGIVDGMSGGNTLEVMNFAKERRSELHSTMTRAEGWLQKQTRPVDMSTVPPAYQKMQRHDWGQVLKNPSTQQSLAGMEK